MAENVSLIGYTRVSKADGSGWRSFGTILPTGLATRNVSLRLRRLFVGPL